MSAQQSNGGEFNPNGINLVKVARYERKIRAPLERVWENVLDWEHLPHLHSTSFNYIELDAAGDWGWRTWSNAEHNAHVELCVADERRYVARTYQAGQQMSEIWTSLTPSDTDTDIIVDFYFVDVQDDAVEGFGEMILTLYTQLWDEDEDMMRERHRRLQERRSDASEIELGSRESLIDRLLDGETILFQLKRREYQLRYHNESLVTHPTICPHLLGPLSDSTIETNQLVCPWHGYRFDMTTGECVSPPGANCTLPNNAALQERDGIIFASG